MSSNKSFLLYSSITPYVHLVPLSSEDSGPQGEHRTFNFLGACENQFLSSGIWSLALSADDREALAGTSNCAICVYDLEKNQLVERVWAHDDDVNSVCYIGPEDETRNLVASGSDDGLIFIWDKRRMTTPVGTLFGHTEGLTCVTSKGDGRYLLSNSKDQTMKLWDLRKMVDCRFAQAPKKAYVWDYRGMSYPGIPGVDRHPCDLSLATFQGHSVLRTLIRCTFSPPVWSGQRYACSASADGKVYIYDLSSTMLVHVYDSRRIESSGNVVRALSWHPYLPILVLTTWNGEVVSFSQEARQQE